MPQHKNIDGKRYYKVKGDPDKLNARYKLRSLYDRTFWNKADKAYRDVCTSDEKRGFNKIALGHPFELMSFEDYLATASLPCYYCSRTPSCGVDRINSEHGHWSSNVLPCCEKCNIILGTLPAAVKENIKSGLKKSFEDGLLENWQPPYKSRKKTWN